MDRDRLRDFYGLKLWPMDPMSIDGRRRFDEAINYFRSMVDHDFIKTLLSGKERVDVLEVCGGTGLGGVALAKVLIERGYNVSLLVTDIREEDLDKVSLWLDDVDMLELRTEACDVLEVHRLGRVFDMVLMYGESTPHFSPWDMVRLLSSISSVVSDDGVFILEDVDRRYNIFYLMKYKDVISGESRDKGVYLDMHVGYDAVRGVFKRSFITLPALKGPINMELYFWGVAELGALMWLYFSDIDIVRHDRLYFIVGRYPRRRFHPEDLSILPKVVSGEATL
jgi:predicted O-methyltransferase YrrM